MAVGQHREDHRSARSRIAPISSPTSAIDHDGRYTPGDSERPPGRPGRPAPHRFPGDGTGFVSQPANHRRNQIRAHRRVRGGVDAVGHSGHGGGHDHVGPHAVRGALDRRRIGQSDDTGFGHGVVGHLVVAVQAADRRGQHDAAVTGVAHQPEGGPHNVEGAPQMDIQHRLEVFVGHLLQRPPPHDPGIVDEDIDPAVAVQRHIDDRLPARGSGHRVGARDGVTARPP